MTDCNHTGLLFSSIKRQEVVGDFEGGQLTSDAGVGKTWLLVTLALQVAMGEPWLGRFETRKAKVLYCEFDNHKRGDSMRRRLLKLTHAMQIHRPWAEIPQGSVTVLTRHDMPSAFNLYQGENIQPFVAQIQKGGYELVIVDTFISIHGAKNENDNSQMGKVMNSLRQITGETDAAFLISHHSRKPGANADENESRVSYRGGTAIKGGADCMIELTPEKDGVIRVKHTKPRHIKQVKDFAVSIQDVDDESGTVVQAEGEDMLNVHKKDRAKGWLMADLWKLDNLQFEQGYLAQARIVAEAKKAGIGSLNVIKDALRELRADGKTEKAHAQKLGLTGNAVFWKRADPEELPFDDEIRVGKDQQ